MRLFTFGCSFTKYKWPTWADILGKSFEVSYNFGQEAAGNRYIFHCLVDSIVKQNISKNDLVIVQWTNFARKDTFDGKWQHSGNNWDMDLESAYRETSGIIASATQLLDAIGCKYIFTSMMPIGWLNDADPLFADIKVNHINKKYEEYHKLIKISMVEHLFNSLPICRNPDPGINGDHHPTPKQHLRYVDDVIAKELNIAISEKVRIWVAEQERLCRL
jgi:hypothetical protein